MLPACKQRCWGLQAARAVFEFGVWVWGSSFGFWGLVDLVLKYGAELGNEQTIAREFRKEGRAKAAIATEGIRGVRAKGKGKLVLMFGVKWVVIWVGVFCLEVKQQQQQQQQQPTWPATSATSS
jgi:hypothetical protein